MQMGSVVKRPNHQECFTRDEGRKEWRGAYTCQWLMRRPFDADGCQSGRTFLSHCDQTKAARKNKAPGSGHKQAAHQRSEFKHAAKKAVHHGLTLPGQVRSMCIFVR